MNSLTIIGNLTKDPELQTTPNGKSVCKFNVAVNRRYQNANGEREADYFFVNVWGVQGENAAKYLVKGKKVAVRGSIEFRAYTDNEGVKRNTHTVNADEVQYLSPAGSAPPGQSSDTTGTSQDKNAGMMPVDDENLPF